MPLPPAPTKRAALLSPDALRRAGPFLAQARAKRTPGGDELGPSAPQRWKSSTAPTPPATVEPAMCSRRSSRRKPNPGTAAARHRGRKAPAQADAAASPRAARQAAIGSCRAAHRRARRTQRKRTKPSGPAKLFVLDTNVLLHDPMCLFRFEEHDIFLPMIVLEELDGHKKGMTEVARNGRQTSRTLDALAGAQGADIAKGLKLDTTGHREAGGKLFFQTAAARLRAADQPAPGQGRQPDPGRGAGAARLHARTPGRPTRGGAGVQGHQHARQGARAGPGRPTTTRTTRRSTTATCCTPARWRCRPTSGPSTSKTVESWQSGSSTFYRISGPIVPSLLDQPVRLLRGARRAEHVRARDRDPRQDRGAQDAEGLRLT